jgi:hypothetical protein
VIRNPLCTEDEFFEDAKRVIKPALDKYERLYIDPTRDMSTSMRAMNACKIFDPFLLASEEISDATFDLLVDELKLLGTGYPEFSDPVFIAGLKAEIKSARAHSRKFFEWESIPSAKNYQTRLTNRLLRERQRVAETQLDTSEYDVDDSPTGREPSYSDWKHDPGERARRIFEWWKVRLVQSREFRYYRDALRLVVPCQASSAAVERVFSQLNMIVRLCGTRHLQESIELRTMFRCNKGVE